MRRALAVLIALAASLLPGVAAAGPLVASSKLVELQPESGGLLGRFSVDNRGSVPVRVLDVRPRAGTGSVPRLPPLLGAAFEDGRREAVLAPGESRGVVVRWAVRRDRGPEELYGHVVVETEADTLNVGVHADRRASFLTDHALSLLLLLPVLGIAVLVGLRRHQKLRQVRFVALGVALLQLGIGGVLYYELDLELSHYHGGGGFQFLEAAPLLPSLGIQYLVGVDGISIGMLLLVPLLIAIAALSGYSLDRRLIAFWSLMLALDAGLIGVFVALDLALLLGAWLVAALSVVFLVGGWSSEPRAGTRTAAYLALAGALVAFGLVQLSGSSGTTLLVDGSVSPRGWAYPELLHADFLTRGLLDPPAMKLVYSALFLGFAVLLAAVPFHGWLVAALGSVPAPAAMVIAAGMTPVGAYGIVRFGYGLLPEATAWASLTLALLGAIGALWAALAALAERELGRFTGYGAAMHAGLILVALSGLTGIGVQSGLAQTVGHGLAAAMLLVVAGALRDRVETADAASFGGLARELPIFAVLAGVAFFGSMGLPGTAPFVSQLMGLFGALPKHPGPALAVLLVMVVMGAAYARQYARVFFGELPAAWRESRFLEPHGGRFPPLWRRERVALGTLAILLILLGFWPSVLLRLSASSALDHADRVVPPGPTQVSARPQSPPSRLLAQAPLR